MKLVSNTGSDRVIDHVRPWLVPGNQLYMATPVLSLFAFGEMSREVSTLARARLILPPANADLTLLGTAADRSRWRARRMAEWLQVKARWIQGQLSGNAGWFAGDGVFIPTNHLIIEITDGSF